MNAHTVRNLIAGPAGPLEVARDEPPAGQPVLGLAVVCHPHPLHGGTLDNKVVQTVTRALVTLGWRCVRLNYRGVGQSAGTWDGGQGETQDALAVVLAMRQGDEPLLLAGFSFGGFVAASAAQALAQQGTAVHRLLLVAPATGNFAVPNVPSDTVVIHGEADDVVPLSSTLDWARPQNLPVVVLPGMGHFFHGQLPLLKNLVCRAFARGIA